MKPYLSIIIPFYNDHSSIGELLASISTSKYAPTFEVIIVDDGSKEKLKTKNPTKRADRQKSKVRKLKVVDESLEFSNIVKKLKTNKRCVGFRIIRQRNKGPAAARNNGAKKARGEFLLFLDSDVELFPDTLQNIAKTYKDDPDIVALTGVWVKEQRTKKFFPNFKALRDWSYWINERDTSGYYFLFSTRIASIKKTVFDRLKGFDESYDAALVEDIELTYRIARRYAVVFAPSVRVRHEFEDFWPIAKKYFWRTFYWTRLFRKRRKFDPVATTMQEALTALSGVAVVFFGVMSLFSLPSLPLIVSLAHLAPVPLYMLSLINYVLFGGSLLIHLLLVRKFLMFVYLEKGFVFAVKSFFTGLVLYCFITAGALWGRVKG